MLVNSFAKVSELYSRSTYMDSGCIEWTGNRDKDGYGRVKINYVQTPVHRLVAKLTYGEPSVNQIAMHSCDNPPCINAEHLRWGSHKENAQDRELKNRGNRKYFKKGEE